MKIIIDDQYYTDESGENYYSDNKSKEEQLNSQYYNEDSNISFYDDKEESSQDVSLDGWDASVDNNFSETDKFSTYEPSNNESFKVVIEDEEIIEEEPVLRKSKRKHKDYDNYSSKGCITVICKLGSIDGVELKGAKINLYMLNGVSPKLCSTELTDSEGKVYFTNLESGCYRVISIVDRRYFEKPCYTTWNEVTIDKYNKEATVCVVNKIKASCSRR